MSEKAQNKWRILKLGEIVQQGDEVTEIGANNWVKVSCIDYGASICTKKFKFRRAT